MVVVCCNYTSRTDVAQVQQLECHMLPMSDYADRIGIEAVLHLANLDLREEYAAYSC